MKCISIRQPWAQLIIDGHKNIENRKWKTNFRGRILVHASLTIDQIAVKENLNYLSRSPFFTTGCILGSIEIIGIITETTLSDKYRLWFEGPFGWVLENPVRFIKPIPYKGQLSIFEVPENINYATE